MKYLKYSGVSLVPNYSEIYSRSDADPRVELFGNKYNLPIIPANMQSVINIDIAKWMSEHNYFYIMHRFGQNLFDLVVQANEENWKNISFSVGVKMPDKMSIEKLSRVRDLRIDFLTIDIAHGHCQRMKAVIDLIKNKLPNTKIIAGNVATADAVKCLADWGADMVKVGIGQDSPCTTKDKTGFTLPMFTCVQNCSKVFSGSFDEEGFEIPIIADGGIKCNGDVAKALVAGAKLVMAGGMFAACTDSPAVSTIINGASHKAYFGSASYENKGHKKHIEGKLNHITSSSMTFKEKLNELHEDIQSAMSYGGGKYLDVFKSVDYVEV